MSSTTPPRRPSTLAADKYAAAKRPVGWAPDPRATARPAEAPMTWSARPLASAATAPTRTPTRTPRAVPRPETKDVAASEKDGQILTSLIVAFVILVLGVLMVNVRGNMRRAGSVAAVSGTLNTVHERQSTFRLLNQRFATWRELEARGIKLPEAQAVVQYNASASHWFISVRDSATGVVCDKTGELFDEGPDDHKPVCREPRE